RSTDPSKSNGNGARLAKSSPDHKLLWEQFGCEFVSLGNYGQDDPDAFYSMTFHRYHLGDRAAGKWDYLGSTQPDVFAGQRKYSSDVHGVPRVLRVGGKDFYFLPSGDGVQVYRIDDAGFYHGDHGDHGGGKRQTKKN